MKTIITTLFIFLSFSVAAENDKYLSAISDIKNNISQQFIDATEYTSERLPPFSIEYPTWAENAKCSALKYSKLFKQRARILFMRKDLTALIIKTEIRNPASLSSIFGNVELLPKIRSIVKNKKFDLTLIINELIIYYNKIINTPNWKSKFDKTHKKHQLLKKGAMYHELGFPKPETQCYMLNTIAYYNNDRYYGDFDSSLEAWLYSFWHRRYKEGTLEITYRILQWITSDKNA